MLLVHKQSVLIFSIALFLCSCATGKIEGDTYTNSAKGYQLALPGSDWMEYKDAWTHRSAFGTTQYWTEEETVIRGTAGNLEKETIPRELKERYVGDVDIGFAHKTHNMKIIVFTSRYADLIEFFQQRNVKLLDQSSKNLIAQYLDLIQTENSHKLIQGIALDDNNFLFISLEADGGAPKEAINHGRAAIDRMLQKL